ncbi:hypothetical protein AB0M32_29755 [Streptomyces sp. NPDC051985]|uniref:hypothetical protein n=1 Tax=Streptomyces sp. NPDC051985 TaxID=3155807 RepID=UPI0034325B77
MEAELVNLVGTGATTLVALMVTDTWEQTKQRVIRLLARGRDSDLVAADLEESRTALIAATGTSDEEDHASDLTASLRVGLRRLLEHDPDAIPELRALVTEFAPSSRLGPSNTVHNSITGGTQHGPVVQGHTFTNLTINTSRETPPERSG